MIRKRSTHHKNSISGAFKGIVALLVVGASTTLALPSDEQQQIIIDCDVQNFQVKEANAAECSGNVLLTQGSLKINGDKLRVENQGSATEKYILTGTPAKVQQQPELDSDIVIIEGELIEFFRPQKQIIAKRNVVLTQGGRIITSHTLNYNMISGKYQSSKSESGDDRVRMVIPPSTGAANSEPEASSDRNANFNTNSNFNTSANSNNSNNIISNHLNNSFAD